MSAWLTRQPEAAPPPPAFAGPPSRTADAGLAAALRDIASVATDPFAPAERAILGIGARLCDASDALGRLTAVFETLPHDLDHALRALHLGATDFLSKPVDESEFLARVRNLLRLHQSHRILTNR